MFIGIIMKGNKEMRGSFIFIRYKRKIFLLRIYIGWRFIFINDIIIRYRFIFIEDIERWEEDLRIEEDCIFRFFLIFRNILLRERSIFDSFVLCMRFMVFIKWSLWFSSLICLFKSFFSFRILFFFLGWSRL